METNTVVNVCSADFQNRDSTITIRKRNLPCCCCFLRKRGMLVAFSRIFPPIRSPFCDKSLQRLLKENMLCYALPPSCKNCSYCCKCWKQVNCKVFFSFIHFQNASQKEGRRKTNTFNGKIWNVTEVRNSRASKCRVSWLNTCMQQVSIFFRMIVSLLFIHVDFQEINLLQCFDQECSSSRKFSILHNRSVYSTQFYFWLEMITVFILFPCPLSGTLQKPFDLPR